MVKAFAYRVALIVVLTLAVLLALTGSALAFSDVPTNHPYATAIADLSAGAIISVWDDGSSGPERPVWRQHFAKMIVLAMALPCSETDVCTFEDVYPDLPGSLYPDHYIAVCAAANITQWDESRSLLFDCATM